MEKKQKNKKKLYLTSIFSNRWFNVLLVLYLVAGSALFLYSFFQIDLNLTLINHPLFLEFQKPFIEFGYYNRPDSVTAYISILLIFYALYLLVLRLIWIKKISVVHVGILILVTCLVLLFSYPASFSHDIFNYMFDARIVTEYGQNPYIHKALDYPSDSWIRFMHWTHRTYPYGPVWLIVTIPLSFIGLGKFLIILLLFKGLITVSYLLISYCIYKILKLIAPAYAVIGTAFFALNPLVIIEGLISAHNDVVMMTLAVFSTYLLIKQKKVSALLVMLLSVGVKFTTVFLTPFIFISFRPFIAFILSLVTFSVISYRIGIQPWYFLWVMPFAAIAAMHRSARIVMVCMTFVFLLRYIPFIESGSWYPSAIPFQNWVTVVGAGVSIGIYLCMILWDRKL